MSNATHIATGLARIGTFLRSEGWRQGEAWGVTPTQAQVLAYLTARGPTRVTAVAKEIAVTQPTATDSVAALVSKGLIEKKPDPEDARATRLHPTAAGRRLAQDLALWPDTLLGAIDTLDAQEQAAFLRSLTKMIRDLQIRGAIPVQRMCATCRFFRPNVHDDPAAPHHCAFVDAAFGDARLRLDCGEHEPADEPDAAALWRSFLGTSAGEADAPPAATGEAS